MIKFVHAADLHLDAPFRSLPPEQAVQLRAEQRELLRKLTDLCHAEQADLLLLSGDLLDSEQVYRETLDALRRAFEGCGAQVFIAPGNHDPATLSSIWHTQVWPQNVHIFTQPQMEWVDVEALGCRVYGAGFTAMDCPPLLEGFRAESPLSLMVLHGEVGQPDSPYNPITQTQIAASGLRYLALGHIHACGGLRWAGSTAYAWPGCPQGRGFDETGPKGVLVGSIDEDTCEVDFRPLAGRQYKILSVQAGDAPLAAILAALPRDTQSDCYRILLTGEAPAPNLPALMDALRERFFSLQLIDQTIPPVELWANCGDDTLKGLFLQSIQDAIGQTEDEQQRQLLRRAARIGLDLMENREVTLP